LPGIPLRNGGPAARIAVIPGDGIGKEVTPEAVKVLRAVASPAKRPMEFVDFDWEPTSICARALACQPTPSKCSATNLTPSCLVRLAILVFLRISTPADILLGLRFKLDLYVNAVDLSLMYRRFSPLFRAYSKA